MKYIVILSIFMMTSNLFAYDGSCNRDGTIYSEGDVYCHDYKNGTCDFRYCEDGDWGNPDGFVSCEPAKECPNYNEMVTSGLIKGDSKL